MIRTIVFAIMLSYCCNNFATNYYISNRGNDNNSGTSPLKPWKTISFVNAKSFKPGDSVLFQAGGTWRDILKIINSGTAEKYIVYSRYGKGRNPRILGSEEAKNWTKTSVPNIWQTAIILEDQSTYPQTQYPGRIFFLQNDSVSWGNFKAYTGDFSNLAKDLDYTVMGSTHYIFSLSDPNKQYDSIEVTQRKHCIQMENNSPQNYIEINSIDFMFSRMNGFYTGYPEFNGATGLIFRNCRIGYIGTKGSGCAYGLGVWHSNLLVENCTITDCGRRGISLNLYKEGWPKGQERKIENVIIRNNIFKRGYHTTSLDLACSDGDGDTIQNVYFYSNIIDDHELTMTDEDKTSNQVFIQSMGGKDEVNNIYIYNNLFIQATARNIGLDNCDTIYILFNTLAGFNPRLNVSPYGNVATGGTRFVDYRNNLLYDNLGKNNLDNFGLHGYGENTSFLSRDYNLYYSLNPGNDRCFTSIFKDGRNFYYQTTAWNSYLFSFPDYDKNSPRPQSPEFMDENKLDFRLKESSPAKHKGTPISFIKTDLLGKKRDAATPSIGAIE